ncbi:receptor-like protein kinase [Pyrus ussuriensis x Pyrus communis]|uniref:Receptor-like protein kinase n=1 Tax=Pyrus ussuriensis x Pyrus communis TaxID=2448454 RepID=A0A5N5IMT9_9ROSA|nr:receptor-like protein kinase [Pyrus ussuriensis x Pyrus communis]KAB2636324.1 receptor-like protein kinase [Pyrus ussuriensis x Pyrus communis]
MVWLKLLFWRYKALRKLKFPMWGYRWPAIPLDRRSSIVILWCLDSFQEQRMPRVLVTISALKASKESLSTSFPAKREEEAELKRKRRKSGCMKINQMLI